MRAIPRLTRWLDSIVGHLLFKTHNEETCERSCALSGRIIAILLENVMRELLSCLTGDQSGLGVQMCRGQFDLVSAPHGIRLKQLT